MDALRYLGLVILCRGIKGHAFVISDDALSWKDSSQLAEPDLIYDIDGVTANISVDTTEDVWVGYYQTRTWFKYLGCVDIGSSTQRYRTMEDPGQCFSACGVQKIIGMFGNKCFCFDDDISSDLQTRYPYCDKECKDRGGIVCGGEMGSNWYLSLYKAIGKDKSSNRNQGNDLVCMYDDHNGLTWQDCSNRSAIMCNGSDTGSWIESTIRCLSNHTRLSGYINTSQTTTPSWSWIVRSQAIYKNSNERHHENNGAMYGYLNRESGVTRLKFTVIGDITKKSLCVDDDVSTSLTSETPLSQSTNNRTLDFSTDDISTRTSDSVSSSKVHVPVASTTPNILISSTGESDVGTIIAATSTVYVVIVVVSSIAVVLLYGKRRCQFPSKKEKHNSNRNNVHGGRAISQPMELLHSCSSTSNNKANNNASNVDSTESFDYVHDYVELEDLDEAPHVSTNRRNLKFHQNTMNLNPYNDLSFEHDSDYDHIGSRNCANGNGKLVSYSENTYDKCTKSINIAYINTSTGVPANVYNMTEDPEDIYNHTNSSRNQQGHNTLEHDYDFVGIIS